MTEEQDEINAKIHDVEVIAHVTIVTETDILKKNPTVDFLNSIELKKKEQLALIEDGNLNFEVKF